MLLSEKKDVVNSIHQQNIRSVVALLIAYRLIQLVPLPLKGKRGVVGGWLIKTPRQDAKRIS
jgi:hypothetical protein